MRSRLRSLLRVAVACCVWPLVGGRLVRGEDAVRGKDGLSETVEFLAGYTAVGIPYEGTGITDAAKLLAWAPGATAVYSYDSANRQWRTWDGTGDNFPVAPGSACFVYSTTGGSAELAGTVATGSSQTLNVGYNLVTQPADAPATTAAEVAAAVPGCHGLWRWEGDGQNWNGYVEGFGGDDFDVPPGAPLLVAVDTPGEWPPPPPFLVVDVAAGPDATSYPVTAAPSLPTPLPDEYRTTKIALRRIPAGTFQMGSPAAELGRADDETPHPVTITRDFYMCVFEVTQKQWERVMGDWPSYYANEAVRDTRPVEQVSWNRARGGDAQPAADSFLGRIVSKTGLNADLPTEAQWEYACRAGTTTALNNGQNLAVVDQCPEVAEVARYSGNGGAAFRPDVGLDQGTAAVGSYAPNAWGLYDMHGNAGEWCRDYYTGNPAGGDDPTGPGTGTTRVCRGGAASDWARSCRSAARGQAAPDAVITPFGFRWAIEPRNYPDDMN